TGRTTLSSAISRRRVVCRRVGRGGAGVACPGGWFGAGRHRDGGHGGTAGEGEERVERVGLQRLATVVASGGAEDLVDEWLEHGVEHGTGLGRAAEAPRTIRVGPAAHEPTAMDPLVRG